ncbi:MAG TPA: ATP-binding protein [Phycisphaerae bacterium]|nr:ATP-binding protein [Phycisphaerae bacterium]
MSSFPGRTPRRIPPTHAPLTSPTDGLGTSAPQGPPDLGTPSPNVTIDAQFLQDRIDDLARQFDWIKSQLRQSQKMAALGTTAAMIAHELNNLLTPVVAYCREALNHNDVELMRTALGKTLDRATAMRNMIDRVVGLARQGDTVIKAVPIRPVVEEAIACLGRDLEKDNLSVHLQVDPQLACRANENLLLQVLFNLITNARQAMLGRRGKLTVESARLDDGRAEIHVRDTGCGISAEHLDAVFEPFFTTKGSAARPDQRGLGLGLAISRDIIEDLDGRIEVTSQVGVGTTFTITLPATE